MTRSRKQLNGFTLIELMIVVAIIGIIFMVIIGAAGHGCKPSDGSEAIRTAETYGFTDARVVKSSMGGTWNGCDSHDNASYDVVAINPQGRQVSVVVCCGGWSGKGCTLRVR